MKICNTKGLFSSRSALLKHGRDIHKSEFTKYRPSPKLKDISMTEEERRRHAMKQRVIYYNKKKKGINEEKRTMRRKLYQQDSSLDDCALPRNADMDKNAKAIILQKTERAYNFNELIIQYGPIQLLAIGGHYGQVGSKAKSAFLGSALPKGCQLSMDETYNILIPFFQPE